ncbi:MULTISPECIES: dihydroneopterin aldolase [unclassified Lysinibacillus]|uniref:dihydroneopterin aldolase n=1 Tax=unclassified Lysinibacillus TaxID=2636778 RepID=UPI0030FCA605
MDYIHLKDMQFYGYHGVLAAETTLGQRFRANVSLAVDMTEAGETDDLKYTVNYAEVYELCRDIVEGEPFKLIEALVSKIANSILSAYPDKVKGVRVELIKPDPPIHGYYKEVSVELIRGDF